MPQTIMNPNDTTDCLCMAEDNIRKEVWERIANVNSKPFKSVMAQFEEIARIGKMAQAWINAREARSLVTGHSIKLEEGGAK